MYNEKIVRAASEDIRKEIENLLQDRFEIAKDVLEREYDEFFGLEGLLTPRELTYLAYMLEQRYNIQFNMEEYENPRFYCLPGLSEIVAKKVGCL